MIRILHLPGMLHGGVGSVIMNIYRRIDKQQYAFDVCVIEDTDHRREIESYGGRVFVIPKRKDVGIINYIKNIKKIIDDNKYEIVHIHSVFTGIFSLIAAYLSHASVRIYHAHNTVDNIVSNSRFSFIIIPVFRYLIGLMSTAKIACGREAGKYVFGNRRFEVIPNGVDLCKFTPLEDMKRDVLREKLGFREEVIVVGNVASFIKVKNQSFFINLAKEDKQGRCRFLLVGDGPMLEDVREKAHEAKMDDRITFLGNRTDAHLLFNVMDVFCLPSFFEGLPVTAIEAQACGTPVVTSSRVTDEADMGIVPYERIDAFNPNDWIECFYKLEKSANRDAEVVRAKIRSMHYDIDDSVNKIVSYYSK
ncbi:MAG: glycosyltransferase [Bacteroidaceae bacterium]|nr:glycosyltransferase [Bacteroidaceae bacterium]